MKSIVNYISPGHPLNAIRSHYANKTRERMFRFFMEKMKPTSSTLILDLGVTADESLPESNFFEKFYPFKEMVTAAGIDDASYLENVYPGMRFARISPGVLPFKDNQFDIVFCSAVLEHVGSREAQRQFITETLRVSKHFFFTTPNRYFPIEFHTFLPLIHWLPQAMHQSILRLVGMDFWAKTENLNLLTHRTLREIFPEYSSVEIDSFMLFGWPSNIIAYGERLAPSVNQDSPQIQAPALIENIQLTILMPCLNEAETLALCINKANAWIAESKIQAEVVIADNGSTDGSQGIAEALGARVVSVSQRGYGSALFHGGMAAKGEWIIMGDSDDSYDFSRLNPFVQKLQEGYDLVMGNRFLGGIALGAMPWKNMYIGNPILTWVGRLLFKCPAKDFHCGLRGFRKDAFLRMDLRTTGMEYASEMVIKANLFGMRIAEVPTTLSKDGRSRPPHLRPWRDGWRHLRFMLLFSPRWLFLIPGSTLFFLSLISYIALLTGPVKIGGLVFDLHTLFFAETGLVLGFLAVSLGVVIRMFGIREGLLGDHSVIDRLRDSPILEIGGALGIIMMAAGLFFGFDALTSWSGVKFGSLAPGELLRTISLSTMLIMLGGVTLMTSLIIGFLALPTREQRF